VKKSQFQSLIKNVVEEQLGRWVSPSELNKQTPQQKGVVQYLEKLNYRVTSTMPADTTGKTVIVIMDKSGGKYGHEEALVNPNGSVTGKAASDIPMSLTGGGLDFSIVEKKLHLKFRIKNMVEKAILNEILGVGPDIHQATITQKRAINTLKKIGFILRNTYPTSDGVGIILIRHKGKLGSPVTRVANIKPDGSINEPHINLSKYLSFVGGGAGGSERGVSLHELSKQTSSQTRAVNHFERRGYHIKSTSPISDRTINVIMTKSGGRFASDEVIIGPDGSVNGKVSATPIIHEKMTTRADLAADVGLGGTMKAVNVAEENEERTCDCGSGLPSKWERDGQGIPLVRACDKCRKQKLSKYRPEILRPYTQADVDEPIEPEDYEEQMGAVGGYATPYVFKKKIREKIGPDGKYQDDMESGVRSKRISGLSEIGVGLTTAAAVGGIAFIYMLLNRIINRGSNIYAGGGEWEKIEITQDNINMMLDLIKAHNPRLKDADIEFVKNQIMNEIKGGTVKTVGDLKKYLKARELESRKKLEEIHRSGLHRLGMDYSIIKKVRNAASRFFKVPVGNIENIKVLYKITPTDIVFEIILGPPRWERKFIRFHGINNPFEVWDEEQEKFVPTLKTVRNFPPEEEENIQEMTATGAIAGYATPFAFSKKKSGSQRALDVTKKLGFKVVESILEKVK
jgi:hypothetical protein